eukprot:TRINITY_DN12530_c0_g1_i13.p2 TRINITY_DN12530_c0_g1~~TRINITY_DN12530_c0_g1_i13.p2  ORF type:complete len:143 (+),score=23.00 TRINITY_DN12530_c0_g1_i13:2-430(+)
MCRFDDGFTDSNSGAQADNKPSGGTCWSTGYIDAETWTYDEVTQTMTIKSIDGQDDRRTKLMVVCSSSSTPQITTKPEDPQRNTTLRSSTTVHASSLSPQLMSFLVKLSPSTAMLLLCAKATPPISSLMLPMHSLDTIKSLI